MTLVACPNCGTQVTPAAGSCPFCGTDTPTASGAGIRYAPQWEAVLEKLRRLTAPKYRVKSILGYGGMAGVFLAEEPKLGRMVAIKVMSPALMVDASMIDRFGQEARTIAQLTHPNIVTIYEVDEREDLQYFVMTHVSGRSLAQVMAEASTPLPIPVVRTWIHQIGDALGYAHELGVVHRDVKPSNVLLDARGNALVTDYGIAKVADEPSLTKTGMLVGSPEYMSPEQCSALKVTGASDQYSLGVVAFQMLTGQPPFRGATLAVLQAHLALAPPPIRDLRPDCPADLVESVSRMLAKSPEDRWPSLAAAIAAAGTRPPGQDDPVRRQMEGLAAHAASISVREWPASLREGDRARVGADVFDSGSRRLGGRKVEWSSNDEIVAVVLPDGTLLARSPGSAEVVATSGTAAIALPVEVEADPVRGLEIRPATLELPRGSSRALEAVVRDFDDKHLEGRAVLWSSQDAEIARVSPAGVVEAVGTGRVVITASTGLKSATAVVEATAGAAAGERSGKASIPGLTPVPGAPPPGIAATEGKPSSRRRLVAAAASLAAVAAVVTIIALASGSPEIPDPLPIPVSATAAGTSPATGPPAATVLAADSETADPRASTDPVSTVARGEPTAPARQPAQTPERVATQTAGTPRRDTAQTAAARDDGNVGATAAPPQPPAPATLRVTGLPANAVVTVRDARGTMTPVVDGSATLPAGTYVATARAPGYQDGSEQIELRPGESRTWSPRLAAVPPPPEPRANPTAAVDRTADQAAIGAAIRGFVAALGRRDADRVVPLLPAEVREAWRGLLGSRAVTDFSASLESVGDARFSGDAATADVVVGVSFRTNNRVERQTLRYTGTLERGPSEWRLTSLRQTGG